MKTITLKSAWTYRTVERTIEFPAGDHEVTNEIAAAAEAEGVTPKEEADGSTDKPAKAGKASATDAGKSG
jgi:hypothetical protein